jgi:hypothetical protein
MYQQEPLQEQINSIIALFSSGQAQEALDAIGVLIKDYPKKLITLKLIQ